MGFIIEYLQKPSNGGLQQIAANRFSTPQDVIAILLQGFVQVSRSAAG
jgi:hypothetical protein